MKVTSSIQVARNLHTCNIRGVPGLKGQAFIEDFVVRMSKPMGQSKTT